jgi:hypothetical protein
MLKNCAQLAAVRAIPVATLIFSQGAVMAFVSAVAERPNRRARKDSAAAVDTDAEIAKTRRRRRSLPSAAAADPPALPQTSSAPVPHSAFVSAEAQLDLLWSELQNQLLKLLAQGLVLPLQQRAFDKLDFSMKQYGKLRRERAADPRGAAQAEPDADELAAILNKMDRRIDALAEERFKKLAERKLLAAGADDRCAGVDV